MTKDEIIKQLESLKENSKSFVDERYPNESRIFLKDIEALDYAINIIKAKGDK